MLVPSECYCNTFICQFMIMTIDYHITLTHAKFLFPTLLEESWTTESDIFQGNAKNSAPDLVLLETNETIF